MGHVDHWNRLAGFGRLQERIRALSPGHLPRPGPALRGLALIGAALALGAWAQGISEGEAVRRWKRDFVPSTELWARALTGLGFVRLEEPGRMHRVLRSLPATLDSSNAVWTDQGRLWVAVFGIDPADPEIRLYFRRRASPGPPAAPQASAWSWAGAGWEGFQEALKRMEPPVADAPVARPKAFFRDPREIRY